MAAYSITGTRSIVRFGSFELDLGSGELWKDGHCPHREALKAGAVTLSYSVPR